MGGHASCSCSDNVTNGAETGVDCGGGTCPGCDLNQGCSTNADCAHSLACTANVCSCPSTPVATGQPCTTECGPDFCADPPMTPTPNFDIGVCQLKGTNCVIQCFPAHSLLTLRDPTSGQSVRRRIADAVPGDEILAVNEDSRLAWTRVVVLRWTEAQLPDTPYLRMTTAAGQVLTVTGAHILYKAPAGRGLEFLTTPNIADNATSVFAAEFAARVPVSGQDVKVGDQLFVHLPGAAGVVASPVVSIEYVVENSAFNLHTLRGNVVVEGIAASQYGPAPHLPNLNVKAVEQLKLAADAKMRLAYRLFPAAVRRLHAWRLLTPLYNAIGALGIQADTAAHGERHFWRAAGAAVSFLLNRLPAAIEAALSGDATFPGVPYLQNVSKAAAVGACAAGAVPHLAVASA